MVLVKSIRWASSLAVLTCLALFMWTAPTSWDQQPDARSWIANLKSHTKNDTPRWLLAIFVSPEDDARREAIRSTWLSRFRHPSFEYRFIVGNLDNTSAGSRLLTENATHGDIWALQEYTNEDYYTANHIKNMEFFKHLVHHLGHDVSRYDLVSKVDSDVWFNVPLYYETFMKSRLPGGQHCNPDTKTVIGRPMVWGSPYAYASGRLYTLSWPMIEFLASKYEVDLLPSLTEDKLMGQYLYEDKMEHEFVCLELEQAWDIGIEGLVDVQNQTMIIHGIKDPARLADINTIFDDEGKWTGATLDGVTNFNRTMPEVIERLREPDERESGLLEVASSLAPSSDPKASVDWQLIQAKISVENRQKMGTMYPLNLPGNNASTNIVPTMLKPIDQNAMNG